MRQTRNKFVWILMWLLLARCVPVAQQVGGDTAGSPGAALQFTDQVYDPNVRTVLCYVQGSAPNEVLNPPVISLSQEKPVILEFDQLNTPQQRFIAKLIYCNADWTEARITQIQYLQDYNEFYITDVSPSFNTKVPYFHYRFQVPPVKLSGNYLLVVTDQNGRNVLSRRLLVYEQQLAVGGRPVQPTGGSVQFTNQQIDFSINYNQFPLVNPAQEVKVVLRQNFRWDNAKYNLRPQYVREAEKRLEYTFFEVQHTFPGLNEYRFYDNRSRRFLGANLATANREVVPEEIYLVPDENRARQAYSQQIDINGRFVIGNRDFGNEGVNGDYQWVYFQLAMPRPLTGEVFVFGELSNWQVLPENQLKYDEVRRVYWGRVLLKQGYYNYAYVLVPPGGKPDETALEGSFQNTENIYDILVYYRPPGTRTDLLLGYQQVPYHPRR